MHACERVSENSHSATCCCIVACLLRLCDPQLFSLGVRACLREFVSHFIQQATIIAHFVARGIETDPKKIRARYLRSWFVIDFIAAVPIDLLATIIFSERTGDGNDEVAFLRATDAAKFLRIPRLFRLLRIFRLARIFSMRANFGAPVSRILLLVFLTVLFIHWDACFEYLAVWLAGFPEGNWADSVQNITNITITGTADTSWKYVAPGPSGPQGQSTSQELSPTMGGGSGSDGLFTQQ